MQNNAETPRESTPAIKMTKSFRLSILAVGAFAIAISAFYLGRTTTEMSPEAATQMIALKASLEQQHAEFVQLKRTTQAKINGMSVRLASLQAGATRINALGQRLVKQGKLDAEEFDFSEEAPVGGPETLALASSSMLILDKNIDDFAAEMAMQQLKLGSLESLLMGRELDRETTPKGWPVRKGWISSRYGTRTDPFTGKKSHHDGIDFVGKRGSDVLAVADGVVVWAGSRSGYGKDIDIDHGNGYVTRYAHNDELDVAVGAAVKTGDVIAKLGSTGRATAPHVHFEVHKNGRSVNPSKFIR